MCCKARLLLFVAASLPAHLSLFPRSPCPLALGSRGGRRSVKSISMKLADDLDFGRMPAFQLVELLRLSESLETKPERETEGGRERERESGSPSAGAPAGCCGSLTWPGPRHARRSRRPSTQGPCSASASGGLRLCKDGKKPMADAAACGRSSRPSDREAQLVCRLLSEAGSCSCILRRALP